MTRQRKLTSVETPRPEAGFLGAGHIARHVVGSDFAKSDPFILLMDDRLDKQDDEPAGGPHPHAGFETVTLVLDGELGDGELGGGHSMKKGDLQVMTAGKGVIHTETIEKKARLRVLQLWLALPKKDRWATPRLQTLPAEHVPASQHDGITTKLYSGSLGDLTSPLANYSQMILADISLEPHTTTRLELPASYNAFLYGIEGSVNVGEEERSLRADQIGWLDRSEDSQASEVVIKAGESGARVVLYAGMPTNDTIVSYGPFIGDEREDIQRLFFEYKRGMMPHISTVPQEQQIIL
jgi:redox-sensitive bicupin YhaK (pirin superfamily)